MLCVGYNRSLISVSHRGIRPMVIYMDNLSRWYMVRHNENEVLTQLKKKERRNYITIIKMEKFLKM